MDAIPHCHMATTVLMKLGLSHPTEPGIDFDSVDGQPVELLFVLLFLNQQIKCI